RAQADGFPAQRMLGLRSSVLPSTSSLDGAEKQTEWTGPPAVRGKIALDHWPSQMTSRALVLFIAACPSISLAGVPSKACSSNLQGFDMKCVLVVAILITPLLGQAETAEEMVSACRKMDSLMEDGLIEFARNYSTGLPRVNRSLLLDIRLLPAA